jgi:hypothetical protein
MSQPSPPSSGGPTRSYHLQAVSRSCAENGATWIPRQKHGHYSNHISRPPTETSDHKPPVGPQATSASHMLPPTPSPHVKPTSSPALQRANLPLPKPCQLHLSRLPSTHQPTCRPSPLNPLGHTAGLMVYARTSATPVLHVSILAKAIRSLQPPPT